MEWFFGIINEIKLEDQALKGRNFPAMGEAHRKIVNMLIALGARKYFLN